MRHSVALFALSTGVQVGFHAGPDGAPAPAPGSGWTQENMSGEGTAIGVQEQLLNEAMNGKNLCAADDEHTCNTKGKGPACRWGKLKGKDGCFAACLFEHETAQTKTAMGGYLCETFNNEVKAEAERIDNEIRIDDELGFPAYVQLAQTDVAPVGNEIGVRDCPACSDLQAQKICEDTEGCVAVAKLAGGRVQLFSAAHDCFSNATETLTTALEAKYFVRCMALHPDGGNDPYDSPLPFGCEYDYTTICPRPTMRYLGCSKDDKPRDFEFQTSNNFFDTEKCAQKCRDGNFKLMAQQWKGKCWCSNDLIRDYKKEDDGCNRFAKDSSMSYNEDGVELGRGYGKWRLAVYDLDPIPPPKYVGCFKDKVTDRDLDGPSMNPERTYSVWECAKACTDLGHKYFGMRFKGICQCGDTFGKHGPQPDGCNRFATGPKVSWVDGVKVGPGFGHYRNVIYDTEAIFDLKPWEHDYSTTTTTTTPV